MINSIKLRKVADEARAEETNQRSIAEANALEAEKQANLATSYAAELAKQKANVEADLMVRTDERDVAVKSADEAVQKTEVVEANLAEVSVNLVEAQSATDAALEEAKRIEREKQEAYRENIALLSQTLASTSLEISYDSELKALLAYQSFKFNEQYGGLRNQANIYLGLRNALKDLDVRYEIIYPGHQESVRSIVYAPKNRWLYSAGGNGRLIRWDRFEGMPEPEVIYKNNTLNTVLALSKDERWLVCGVEGLGIQVFDLGKPGSTPRVFSAHQNQVRSIAMFNDNRSMLTCGMDNTVYKWDLETGIREIFHELDNPKTLAISANDQTIAVGTRDGKVLLFSGGDSDSPIELSNEPGNRIWSLAFRSKDNMLIVGDQKGVLKIWSIDQRELGFRKKVHQARIFDIKVDPSQRYLATCSTDGSVFVFDLEDTNLPPIEITKLNGFIYSVEFINRGRNLVIGSKSSNPLVGFPVRMEDLSTFICPNISRNLSQSEWQNYIGDDVPFEETCNK
jgi:hypothetical protein